MPVIRIHAAPPPDTTPDAFLAYAKVTAQKSGASVLQDRWLDGTLRLVLYVGRPRMMGGRKTPGPVSVVRVLTRRTRTEWSLTPCEPS